MSLFHFEDLHQLRRVTDQAYKELCVEGKSILPMSKIAVSDARSWTLWCKQIEKVMDLRSKWKSYQDVLDRTEADFKLAKEVAWRQTNRQLAAGEYDKQ